MMPTRALERLVHAAAWRSARLVLVGDRAQLPAIDAGGGFAALADRLGAVELTENRRQQTELQRDVARHLAEGRAADAVALLSESGRLQSFEDARDARVALVSAWAQAELDSPGRNLMLAHDRHDVAELNRIAQGVARAVGPHLGSADHGRRNRVGDRRSDGVPPERLLPRGAQRHPGYGRRPRPPRRAPGSVHRPRRVVRIPADYLAHARHGYALTGHVSRASRSIAPLSLPPRARRGRVGVRRRIASAP